MQKAESLPKKSTGLTCPKCKKTRCVNAVKSMDMKWSKRHKFYYQTHAKAYYCKECLIEFDESGQIREPLLN